MIVQFLLFVIAILLILIFWELSKINSRLKKTLVRPRHHEGQQALRINSPVPPIYNPAPLRDSVIHRILLAGEHVKSDGLDLYRNSRSARYCVVHSDGDGKAITNKILLSLSSKECKEVLSKLEFVRLQLHQVIHEAGESVKSNYFVNTGLMSVLAVQPDGNCMNLPRMYRPSGLCATPLRQKPLLS